MIEKVFNSVLKSNSNNKDEGVSGCFFIVFLIVLIILFFNTPGMFIVALITKHNSIKIEMWIMWFLSIIFSLAIAYIINHVVKIPKKTILYYELISILIILFLMYLKNYTKNNLPNYIWVSFFGN